MDDWSSWVIPTDERIKFDSQFQLLRPINGYLTGEQLKPYFFKFGLSVPVLGQIWGLADIDVDGRLDKREFAIAMFLIHKSLTRVPLPPTLPEGLRNNPPSGFVTPVLSRTHTSSSPKPVSPTMTHTNGEMSGPSTFNVDNSSTRQSEYHSWTISPDCRPKYRLLFNQHDRTKRGYITGIEARGIFVKSGLSQQILAHIWTLADLDKDGNLNIDEFCIATFLIDKALAGHQLPTSLPPGLMPSIYRANEQKVLAVGSSAGRPNEDGVAPSFSFEDKRRENFLQGQIELDKRKQELAEKLRQEEEERLEKERQERERQERIRMEAEKQKSLEAERQAERARELEAQKELRRRQAFEERTRAWRAIEAQRITETEHQRVETLKREKMHAQTLLEQAVAHRASLLESASAQDQRRRELSQRLMNTTNDLNAHKDAITEMRNKRDTYERDIRELTEQVEAAKAELARWQREREELSLRQSTTSPTAELHKSLVGNQNLHRNDIKRLNRQVVDLEQQMTEQGHELARRRNTMDDLEHCATRLQSEVDELRQTLQQKVRKHKSSQHSPGDLVPRNVPSSHDLELYEVMFQFTARHPDELSLTTGSLVHVHTKPPVSVAPGWLYGEAGDQKGLFPESYVRKREAGKIDPFDPFGVHSALSSAETTSGPSQPPPLVEHPAQSVGSNARAFSGQPLFTCIAVYPFDSDVAGDLKLAVGDVVQVYNVRDEWWEGVCVRTKLSGMFPANYANKVPTKETGSLEEKNDDTNSVAAPSLICQSQPDAVDVSAVRPISEVSTVPPTNADLPTVAQSANDSAFTGGLDTTNKPELARVIAPYTAVSSDQLSLQPGQLVQVRRRSSKGWWEGELQQRGRVRQYGWFPADYVKLVTPSSSDTNGTSGNVTGSSESPSTFTEVAKTTAPVSNTSSTPSPTVTVAKASSPQSAFQTGSAVERMQAIFSYKAAHADELTFDEGSIITVLGRDEPEWWRGRIQSTGAEGLFPVNYVRPYNCPAATVTSIKSTESGRTTSGAAVNLSSAKS